MFSSIHYLLPSFDILFLKIQYEGGHPGLAIDDCLIFDHSQPAGQQWSSMLSLPTPRAGGALLFLEDDNALLFATGAFRPVAGRPGADDNSDVWMFRFDSPEAGWVVQTPIPYAANHVSYVTARGSDGRARHYVMGGQLNEDERGGNFADLYEWTSGSWTRRADMLQTRGHASSSTVAYHKSCGFVIVAGSSNEAAGRIADVSHYNVDTDVWTRLGDLNTVVNTPVCVITTADAVPTFGTDAIHCDTGFIGRANSVMMSIDAI